MAKRQTKAQVMLAVGCGAVDVLRWTADRAGFREMVADISL